MCVCVCVEEWVFLYRRVWTYVVNKYVYIRMLVYSIIKRQVMEVGGF